MEVEVEEVEVEADQMDRKEERKEVPGSCNDKAAFKFCKHRLSRKKAAPFLQ